MVINGLGNILLALGIGIPAMILTIFCLVRGEKATRACAITASSVLLATLWLRLLPEAYLLHLLAGVVAFLISRYRTKNQLRRGTIDRS